MLTPKEHFICHYLLTKIYQEDSLVCAFSIMCNRTPGKTAKDYKVYRERYSKIQSKISKVNANRPEIKESARNRMKKRMSDPDYRQKLILAQDNPETKIKKGRIIRERMKDPIYKEKQIQNLRDYWSKEENREKRRQKTLLENEQNPELKAKRIAAITREHNTPEHNKNIGLAHKKYVAEHPEYYQWLIDRVSGDKNPNARPVINYKTKEIYGSAKTVSDLISMNYNTLKKYLYLKKYDRIDYMWYDEYLTQEK